MQSRILLLVLVSGLEGGVAHAAPPTVDALLTQCADKTIVVNKDAQKVGERLGGYCNAYLQATLDAIRNSATKLCDNNEDRSPEYLLSVFQTYLADVKVDKTSDASKALVAAYRRAFSCSASKK